jgi:hypothetical protein
MIDLYLRADGEDHLNSSLVAASLATEDADGFRLAPGVHLDVIGEVVRIDADGNEQRIPGCHANLRLVGIDLTSEQFDILPVIPTPNNPQRVWA